ncbi:MAG: isopenicillin N synthase family oxygenase [Proteobacteria bacterium]|nr:isopenicillin N synthase family oxygenase [Pseudomonadota bacterium]
MGLPLDELTAPAQVPPCDEGIPVLDVGPYLQGMPGALAPLAAALGDACRNVGFHFIVNHGVPQAKVDRLFEENARFHSQPLERKLELKVDANVVGYLPMAYGLSRSAGLTGLTKPNINESFFVRNELSPDDPDMLAGKPFRSLNKWPADLPGFREAVLDYFTALEALAHRLLPVYATALGMHGDFFDAAFARDRSTLRLAHYPPSPVLDDQFGSAPHTDGGFMTLLAQAHVPGLEVYSRGSGWIEAPVIEGAFLVNSGDLLAFWSNDRFLSTPHRVINRSGTERYSIPFFFNPDLDARIECIPSCVDDAHPARYEPTTYLDYYRRTKFRYATDGEPADSAKPGRAG